MTPRPILHAKTTKVTELTEHVDPSPRPSRPTSYGIIRDRVRKRVAPPMPDVARARRPTSVEQREMHAALDRMLDDERRLREHGHSPHIQGFITVKQWDHGMRH